MDKKKILFSAYSLDLGGIETALISLINHLAEKYDITLVLEKKQGMFLDKVDGNIKIVEYKPSYSKIRLIAKCVNLYKRIAFAVKFKNKFDFACSYATYCQMASVVARIASTNSALWVHNNYYEFFNKDIDKYRDFFDTINAHSFNNVVFVSDEAKEQYIEKYGVKNEQVLTCNNLIDYKNIIKLSEENIDIKRDYKVTTFVNVSRHDEHQKRIIRLLECAKMLKNNNEKFRILLVGSGQDTEEYKEFVKENKLENEVVFVGKTTNPYPYFKVSDCVVLTSEYEGFPVTYVESKILGKPIITTAVSDSRIDIDNKFGIVTEKNARSIYIAMKDFINNGFKIREKFDAELFNQEIIKKVEDIINERN